MNDKKTISAPLGKKVLDVALENKMNIEGRYCHYCDIMSAYYCVSAIV